MTPSPVIVAPAIEAWLSVVPTLIATAAPTVAVPSGALVALTSVAFHKGGLRLASAGADNTVRLWDLITGQEILELQVPAGPLRSVAFSPDGRRLAAAGPQIPPRIWEALARRL